MNIEELSREQKHYDELLDSFKRSDTFKILSRVCDTNNIEHAMCIGISLQFGEERTIDLAYKWLRKNTSLSEELLDKFCKEIKE